MPQSIELMAYEAFRTGKVTPELRAFAAREIERRGIGPAIARAEAAVAKAFGPAKREGAA